ncbi:transposase [Mycobacterium ulcerans Agy99]|uniref:Transposase n=1 Tax=Mycobacterium ulcerans (strain Agy99) TaxID=362242 RepID=A0PRS8_MYCUA|nr:transposase [Mycobacterium ulcerans Agy99]OIN34153.1 transposase [Mycobacterium ulcerans]
MLRGLVGWGSAGEGGKRKSGASGASADLALLEKLMADAGRDLFARVFDEPTPVVRVGPE